MVDGYISVLLVEDDEDDIFITRHLLDEAGPQNFKVQVARTLNEALKQMDQASPHVVLLDLALPDSTGLDTLTRLLEQAPDLPIILLTGGVDKALGLRAVKAGAQDFLFKGHLERERLWRSINYAIERKHAELDLKRYRDELEERVEERTRELEEANRRLTQEIRIRKAAEKETEDAKRYLESIICTSQDGITVVNSVGEFEFMNKACVKILGWPQDELIGCSFFKVIPEKDLAETEERWQKVQKGMPTSSVFEIVTKDNSLRTIAVSQQRAKINGEYKYCVALRDVTESQRQQKELIAANEQLRQHDHARGEFVFNVSHELKTPLASMSYAIGNMLKGIVGDLPPTMLKYVKMMDEDVRRLGQTVEDILDLSRIESNSLKLDKVKIPLFRLVKQTLASMRLQAEGTGIKLTLTGENTTAFAECDPRKIERVILNIVRNAEKFTPSGGTIEVNCDIADDDDGMLRISIIDSGIGIEPEYLNRVTERYFRVGEHVDGTGLGLAISKDVLELHGGRLEIESPPRGRENGTAVYLYIPRCEHPDILVVDDDEQTRKLICCQLEMNGYLAEAKCNGAEALRYLEKNLPYAVVTDLVMPIMDGVSMIAEMKAHADWRYIPVVVVSAGELSQAKREILEGFDIPALSKPFQREDLLDLIENTVFGMQYLSGGGRS